MQSEYTLPLTGSKHANEALDFRMVLNENKEIIWVNDKAARLFQSDLCIERHIDPSSFHKVEKFFTEVKESTIKKSYVSLLNKQKKILHFFAYGMFDQWNETYVISFRIVKDIVSLVEFYNKTFKMLDDIKIGACVAKLNGFIFSANETAKYFIPNVCNMSVVSLLRKFFDDKQFDYYIKLLNNREEFSANITCQSTNEKYRLIYKFDSDSELHFFKIQHYLLKDHGEKLPKSPNYLDMQTAASIVHEIRNPLTALQGLVELMKVDDTNKTTILPVIGDELHRMDQLLTGMLQLLKPKVECSAIELNSFLQKIFRLVEIDVKNKKTCLIYSQGAEPYYIVGNEHSLTQVFINVIKNSIQAMSSNGSITITLNKVHSNEIEICIKDSGCGLSEEQLAELFKPYYTTKEDGTGLGLPVVKKLLEEMNGRVEVRSELGQGTEVYIYLQEALDHRFILAN